jgi:hypothetical protein
VVADSTNDHGLDPPAHSNRKARAAPLVTVVIQLAPVLSSVEGKGDSGTVLNAEHFISRKSHGVALGTWPPMHTYHKNSVS